MTVSEGETRSLANQVVMPLVTPDQARAQWRQYEEIKAAILDDSDYVMIQGKKTPKKSAFRKLAVFFGLNDEIVKEERVDRDDSSFTWSFTVRAIAPNGRATVNVGLCDSREKKFAHVEHDVKSTAHTRAKNRAISDMVAGGEVSAEEMGADETEKMPPSPPKRDPPKKVDAEAKPVEKPAAPGRFDVPQKVESFDDEERRVQATLEANNLPLTDVFIEHQGRKVLVFPGPRFPREMKGDYDRILGLLGGKWLGLENRWEVPL